jgi:hypothetical protein
MPTWAALLGQVTASGPAGPPVVAGPGSVMVLAANVTAPVRARALPFSAAPELTVTDTWARIVP